MRSNSNFDTRTSSETKFMRGKNETQIIPSLNVRFENTLRLINSLLY